MTVMARAVFGVFFVVVLCDARRWPDTAHAPSLLPSEAKSGSEVAAKEPKAKTVFEAAKEPPTVHPGTVRRAQANVSAPSSPCDAQVRLASFSPGELGFTLYTEGPNHLHMTCHAVGQPDPNKTSLAVTQRVVTEAHVRQPNARLRYTRSALTASLVLTRAVPARSSGHRELPARPERHIPVHEPERVGQHEPRDHRAQRRQRL
jgi:hypothetical protein